MTMMSITDVLRRVEEASAEAVVAEHLERIQNGRPTKIPYHFHGLIITLANVTRNRARINQPTNPSIVTATIR